MTDQQQNYISSSQNFSQLQNNQYGVLTSTSPTKMSLQNSTEIIKPTVVYSYSSSSGVGGGDVVQYNQKSSILPTANIYSSFEPTKNVYTVTTTGNVGNTTGNVGTTIGNIGTYSSPSNQYVISNNSFQIPAYQPISGKSSPVANNYSNTNNYSNANNYDEIVKRSKNKDGTKGDSSDSSDDDNKVVTELKFSKKKWGKAYILYAKTYIEQLNNKLISKDAHISQLIKATDLKDNEIQQLNSQINQLRISGGGSTTINIQSSREYINLQQEVMNLRLKNEELEIDNQQFAQIIIAKDEEKAELLREINLLQSRIDSLQQQSSTVVLQSNYSNDAELQVWKRKCGELEESINALRKSTTTQNNYQLEMLNLQLSSKNADFERLNAQLQSLQKNSSMLIDLERENSSLKSQISSLNIQIQQLNSQVSQYTIQITQLNSQVQEAGSSKINVSSFELKIRDYELQIQRMSEELRQASSQRSKLELIEGQIIQLTSELKRKELEVQEYRTRISQIEGQLNFNLQNSSESESLKRTIREQEDKLRMQENQSGNEVRLREQEIQELRFRCTNYEQQLLMNQSSSAELESLRRSVREYEDKLRQIESRGSSDIRMREEEIQELRKRCSNYELSQNSNQNALYELESLRRTLREYEDKLRLLESQKNNSSQLETLNVEIYNLSNQLKIQNQDAQDLRIRCENFQRQIGEAEAKYNSINSKYQESEYNNKIIIEENSKILNRIKELEYSSTQVNNYGMYDPQINQMRESYFDILVQFVLVCSALESQSNHKSQSYSQPSIVVNNYSEVSDLRLQIQRYEDKIRSLELSQSSYQFNQQQSGEMYSLQQEIKILRQDNIDLAQRWTSIQASIEQKDAEIRRLIQQFGEIENSNRIIIQENSKLIQSLQEKDSQILRLQSMQSNSYTPDTTQEMLMRIVLLTAVIESISQNGNNVNSSQISILQLEISDWRNRFEQSRQDILIICQETEKLKVLISEKDREITQLR